MKRLITENFGLKVISVLAAFGLWAAATVREDLNASITVPVEYTNFPRGLEVSTGFVSSVSLLVHGAPDKLTPTYLSNAAVIVDLGDVQSPGKRTFNLKEATLRLPDGLTVEQATPSQIQLEFETRVAKDIPVQIRYANNPMAGYSVVSQIVSPPTLRVIGPESKVRDLQSAETDPIDLSGVIGETEFRLNTFVDSPLVRIEGNSRVQVRVTVERITGPANTPPAATPASAAKKELGKP